MSCTCGGWEGAGEGPERGLETCVLEEENGEEEGREGGAEEAGGGEDFTHRGPGAPPASLLGWLPGSQAPAEGPRPAVCWVVVVVGGWRYPWRAHSSPSEEAPSPGPAWPRLGATGGRTEPGAWAGGSMGSRKPPAAASAAARCSSEPARLPPPQPIPIPTFAHRLMGGQGGRACGLPTPTVRWGPCMGLQIGLAAGSRFRNRLCGSPVGMWGASGETDLWRLGSGA